MTDSISALTYALPDNTAEVITQVIIALLTWWLGRKQGQIKQMRASKGANHKD